MSAARALDYEIAVVGTGLAGAAAAALLARHAGIAAERIVVLTSELPLAPPPNAPPELRVVAISRASERVLTAAGAWTRLEAARLCAYERMRVWHESASAHGAAVLCFDAAELGEPNLGYIGENGALQRACLDSFSAAGGSVRCAQLVALAFEQDRAVLQLSGGEALSARLVIGADGAQSLVRRQARLAVRTRRYEQLALIARIETAAPHAHTAWQRFLRSGPLALLPLFDGSCSLVWTLDVAQGMPLSDCAVAQFNQQLEAASDGVLGTPRLASERVCLPLFSLAADSYVAPRCALIGDAAHVIHPLAGQGANLGLLDAAAICEAVGAGLARREDPGALRTLRAYEQQRRTDNLMMASTMSLMQSAFSRGGAAAAWCVNGGLGMVNRSAVLKRAFAQRALGNSGELPRLARPGALA